MADGTSTSNAMTTTRSAFILRICSPLRIIEVGATVLHKTHKSSSLIFTSVRFVALLVEVVEAYELPARLRVLEMIKHHFISGCIGTCDAELRRIACVYLGF